MFGIFFTNDLLISDFNMPSHSPPIVWKGDPDMPGVEIRELSVNILKCTYVSGEEHFGEEQSIIDSIMESVNITVPLRVVKDIPVLNSLFSPILASNCALPPVAGGSVEVKQDIKAPDSPDSPDSAPDGGPLENLSDSELVADLEGLNLIDPVPQIEEHLSDNKYQFRTRCTKIANKIEESSPDSPDLPDSGSDGGPLLNLSDTELVADLEGFGRLNIIDPVPQIEKHLSDNKYQFRTRHTKMADNIQESSPEDLFEESESDFVPEDDDSESDHEDKIKEAVGGTR